MTTPKSAKISEIDFALLHKDFSYMKGDLKEIKGQLIEITSKLSNKYVSKDDLAKELSLVHEQYGPVKKIVFALVALILTAVVSAWVLVVIS